MKRYLLIFVMALVALGVATPSNAQKDNSVQRRSDFPFSTFPKPYTDGNLIGNPHNSPAVSTGYYFVESGDPAPDYWQPKEQIFDIEEEPETWRRVLPGPRIQNKEFWDNHPEGLPFFRDPALPAGGRSFFDHGIDNATDSTDDAIAGPMPMFRVGEFYFNGIRYDSFYVSTNGVVALTNRRYFYNAEGQRQVQTSTGNCYDPQSMAWFVGTLGSDNWNRTGDGLSDTRADDFGYKWAVNGGTPLTSRLGIRARASAPANGALTSTEGGPFNVSHKAALIAPFFGDNHLSQWWQEAGISDDFGQVHYKRTKDFSKFVIYFKNIAPKSVGGQGPSSPAKATPYGTYNAAANLRPGESNFTAASAQVVLNRLDSSVTILYEQFIGSASVGGRVVPSEVVFRYNNTAGVRGFARHINYNRTGGPVAPGNIYYPYAAEYEQFTHYFKFDQFQASYPRNRLNVLFKQWQNTVRVVGIEYRIRKQIPNGDLDFTVEVPTSQVNDYELLAGDDRLGAIQPVAIIQNMSNDIQGPFGTNYVKQDLNFQARFRIINEATGNIIYNRIVPVDSLCMATPDINAVNCNGNPDVKIRSVNVTFSAPNYKATVKTFPGTNSWNGKKENGVPPYGFVQVFFPPFEPNELATDKNNKLTNIGRMRAYIIADPRDNNGDKLGRGGDAWPFDDTTNVRLFVMNRLESFKDDVTEFHLIGTTPMPSVYKWVNIDADIANGEIVSRYPLPPRGQYKADNNENYYRTSPVIHMDRKQANGFDHANNEATGKRGDQIRSYPVDLRGKFGAVLSLAIQRTANVDDWENGYGDGQLIGAEPRSVLNGDPFAIWNNPATSVANKQDEIVVEFAKSSPNGVSGITNIPNKDWRFHPRRGGAATITNVPALSVYGAGGYLTGFLETDKDSALALPDAANGYLNSLRPDLYDDGIDFEYKTYYVAIPDTFINAPAFGAKNFRFRVKVECNDDQKNPPLGIPDDNDDFYVDNIRILFRSKEQTDISVTSTKIDWPYTQAPATQATSIPVNVKVSNNTSTQAPTYDVLVYIFKGENIDIKDLSQLQVYCRRQQITDHPSNIEMDVKMPDFNARNAGPGKYTMYAIVQVPGGDLEELNDTTYTNFELKFGPTFAYDPVDKPKSNVEEAAFANKNGRGLNIEGFAYGGNGTANGQVGAFDFALMSGGYVGGSVSGQIAMKFKLLQTDTVFGYQAYFCTANQAPDVISFQIYNDQGNVPGSQVMAGSYMEAERGRDWERNNDLFFGEYVNYRLPKGVVLDGGKSYWMVIAQMGETGLELGASKSRGFMRTTNANVPPPIFVTKAVGDNGTSLNIHKEFRQYTTGTRRNLINRNFFALENTRNSGVWNQFSPTVGNPAYPHLHHFGTSPVDGFTYTLTRGWSTPMIRPYLGNKKFNSGKEITYDDCEARVPVEIVNFDGEVRTGAIDLNWSTASETNNSHFIVERRIASEENDNEWRAAGKVAGNGNSNTTKYYTFSDENVMANTTYQYRLRQVDFDGTQNCKESQIVTLTFEGESRLVLEQNTPNPFADNTKISFTLPEAGLAKVDVLDIFGNVVATVANTNFAAGTHSLDFNAMNEAGMPLLNGTYVYRLTFNNEVVTSKMTIVR